ncbi:YfiR family protein [Thauera sp. AutoDN2]|uniref:YfiR family protein n=1 Tax=Thauera sp. AutoDN2 TaxID=3416051 RepID=UPI003F4C95AD
MGVLMHAPAVRRRPTASARWLLVLGASFALSLASTAGAAAPTAKESSLQAALVFNLIRFTAWPASIASSAPLTVCTITENLELANAYLDYHGRKVGEHTLQIQRRGILAQLDDCAVVHFDQVDIPLLTERLHRLAGRPVLTISTPPHTGSMIGLARDNNRVAFQVNLEPLRQAGLKLPAQVLQLARSVQ